MASIAWPALLKPLSFGFWLENSDQSGGVSMLGNEQFVASPGQRWRASMAVNIRSNEQILALRSLLAQLDGRFNDVLLPGFDGKRLSWPVDSETGVSLKPRNTRDRTLDGTAYEDPEIPSESQITATLNASAALRATTIAINVAQGGTPLAGQRVGIASRLYELATIVSTVGTVTTATIRPPLRAAASSGASVLFTRPVCLMKLLNGSEALTRLESMRFANVDLQFQESF